MDNGTFTNNGGSYISGSSANKIYTGSTANQILTVDEMINFDFTIAAGKKLIVPHGKTLTLDKQNHTGFTLTINGELWNSGTINRTTGITITNTTGTTITTTTANNFISLGDYYIAGVLQPAQNNRELILTTSNYTLDFDLDIPDEKKLIVRGSFGIDITSGKINFIGSKSRVWSEGPFGSNTSTDSSDWSGDGIVFSPNFNGSPNHNGVQNTNGNILAIISIIPTLLLNMEEHPIPR